MNVAGRFPTVHLRPNKVTRGLPTQFLRSHRGDDALADGKPY